MTRNTRSRVNLFKISRISNLSLTLTAWAEEAWCNSIALRPWIQPSRKPFQFRQVGILKENEFRSKELKSVRRLIWPAVLRRLIAETKSLKIKSQWKWWRETILDSFKCHNRRNSSRSNSRCSNNHFNSHSRISSNSCKSNSSSRSKLNKWEHFCLRNRR